MTKKVNDKAIQEMQNELRNASVFFRRDPQKQAPEAQKTVLEAPEPTQPLSQVVKTEKAQENVPSNEAQVKSEDVKTDVTTSPLQDIDKKYWREIIEDTEAHNSSLRMSAQEKEQIEDVVRELKRTYKVKTSMNEIARLGLLFLVHDFKQKGEKSIIADVKKS